MRSIWTTNVKVYIPNAMYMATDENTDKLLPMLLFSGKRVDAVCNKAATTTQLTMVNAMVSFHIFLLTRDKKIMIGQMRRMALIDE